MAEIIPAEVAHNLAYGNLLQVFGNRDRASRLRAIQETYHSDATFYETDSVITGHDGINTRCEELFSMREGWGFVPVGNVQRNHTMVYLAWGWGPQNEATGAVDIQVKGADVLIVDQGKVRTFWVIIEGMTDVKA